MERADASASRGGGRAGCGGVRRQLRLQRGRERRGGRLRVGHARADHGQAQLGVGGGTPRSRRRAAVNVNVHFARHRAAHLPACPIFACPAQPQPAPHPCSATQPPGACRSTRQQRGAAPPADNKPCESASRGGPPLRAAHHAFEILHESRSRRRAEPVARWGRAAAARWLRRHRHACVPRPRLLPIERCPNWAWPAGACRWEDGQLVRGHLDGPDRAQQQAAERVTLELPSGASVMVQQQVGGGWAGGARAAAAAACLSRNRAVLPA
jgi:hypothetical protein